MRIADFLPHIPAAIAEVLLGQLRSALPLPVPDTPENREIRDRAAFAAVKAINPTNAADAMFATLIVAMEAGARDTLRMADDEVRWDFATALRLRKLGDRMMREAQRSRNLLRHGQAQPPRQASPPEPAVPTPALARGSEAGRQERAARIRALDVRLIDPPPTIH